MGEGHHSHAGQPHAEAVALQHAGQRAAGATAYVTLEPCSHWGRTPPCADALIRAGVSRVVTAVLDPDPRVSGAGLDRLRQSGIDITVGVLERDARLLNEAYFHFQAAGTPFVTLKSAMTLDGKIATRSGDSRWVTGQPARAHAHRIRAKSGAVLVGIGTVLADDPRLTARLDPPPPRQPLRVIVDSMLRTPPCCEAVRVAREQPCDSPLLIATTDAADEERERLLTADGVEVLRTATAMDGRVDLAQLLRILGQRRITSVLVDGGGQLHAAFVSARLAHKALFYLAPKIVGGRDALTPVEGDGVALMSEAAPLHRSTVRTVGEDILIEAYFVE